MRKLRIKRNTRSEIVVRRWEVVGRSREVLDKTVNGNENVSGERCRHAGLNGCVIGME